MELLGPVAGVHDKAARAQALTAGVARGPAGFERVVLASLAREEDALEWPLNFVDCVEAPPAVAVLSFARKVEQFADVGEVGFDGVVAFPVSRGFGGLGALAGLSGLLNRNQPRFRGR